MGMSLIEERGMDIKVDQETPETRWGGGRKIEVLECDIFKKAEKIYRYSREKHL